MPVLIVRGKTGVPQTTQEGNTIVVKKDIANAVLEERHPATRRNGKQAPTAVYTKAEVKAKVDAAKSEHGLNIAKQASGLLAAQKKEVEAMAFEAADVLLKRQEKKTKAAVKTLKNNVQARNQKTKAIQASAAEKIAKAERDSAKAERDTAKAIALNKELLETNEQQAKDLKRIRKARTDFRASQAETATRGAPGTPATSSMAPKTPVARAPGTPAASTAAPRTPAQRGRSRSMAR